MGVKRAPFGLKKGEDLENREAYSSWELLGNAAPAHSHSNKPFIFLQVTPTSSVQVELIPHKCYPASRGYIFAVWAVVRKVASADRR